MTPLLTVFKFKSVFSIKNVKASITSWRNSWHNKFRIIWEQTEYNNKILEASEHETNRIRSGLDKLKIMKIGTKEELEEIEIELMSLKGRMARYKIDFKSEL